MAASPFPGMDPYLERHWLDVHLSLVSASRNTLNELLPEDLIARGEELIAVGGGDSDGDPPRRRYGPDVQVYETVQGFASQPRAAMEGGVAALAPYRLEAIVAPIRQRYIEIIDTANEDRLVTVLEIISPSNTKGNGLKKYLRKRNRFINSRVGAVEICLHRGVNWRKLVDPMHPPSGVNPPYCAIIHVGDDDHDTWFHPMPLGEPLPDVSVPLRPGEQAVKLPLQSLVEQAYRHGRYGRTLRYDGELDPPLAGEELATASRFLSEAGRR